MRIDGEGETTYLIYDKGNNLLAEANARKQITRYYIHGSGLLSMIQNQQSYPYHFSATGHTLAMTDSTQAIVNQYAYGPYGRILGESETAGLEQPFKYVGQYGVQHEGGIFIICGRDIMMRIRDGLSKKTRLGLRAD